MKKEFSKNWKGSTKPKKQRKYSINLPLHLRKKLLSVNLSKELRKKHNKRNIPLRKGDSVQIMRGKFKGKKGKVERVSLKESKIYVEGIQIKKKDGSKVDVPLRHSNLQILELNLEDKRRISKKENTKSNKNTKIEKNIKSEKDEIASNKSNEIDSEKKETKSDKSKLKK